jgi:7,8-dihydropterin-6-yl-methyl-4-(beta-D-ribofuranosyl)aminobenzene 5'-phosphate synthase
MGFRTASYLSVSVCCTVLVACSTAYTARSSPAAEQPKITVLYDAFGKVPALQKDWGYSALVEVNGKRILFDTGDNPDILGANAKALGVDLSHLDFVVLSHRHGDHMGGMEYLLKVNPMVKIYAPKENFGVYGASLPSKFYRKNDKLPPFMRYYDGSPPETMVFGSAWPRANFELVDQTEEIAPGIHLIALVSDKPTTLELKELTLAIQTPDGLVLVVGCSHPGLDKIVAAAQAIDPHIHLIVGGFHLVVAPDEAIAQIATLLHDTAKVDYIAPGHCTGEPTFAALMQAFGDHYLYAGLGTVIALGAQPHSVTASITLPLALDSEDRATYSMLYALSDDARSDEDSLLASAQFNLRDELALR